MNQKGSNENLNQGWIPFTFNENGVLDCLLPDNDERLLVSDGQSVWMDYLFQDVEDGNIVYFLEYADNLKGLAWMSLPKPYVKEVD